MGCDTDFAMYSVFFIINLNKNCIKKYFINNLFTFKINQHRFYTNYVQIC